MKVLVVTLPEKGHYHPLLGPALELARRGHDVAFASTYDIRAELLAAGASRVVLPADAPPPPAGLRGDALARVLADPAALAGWIRMLLVDDPRAGIDPLRTLIRAERPDAIAIDTMAYDAAIAADLEGVPWVGWSTSLNPVVPASMDSALIRTIRALDADRQGVFAARGGTARFCISDVMSPRGTAVFAAPALTGPAPDGVHLVGPSLGGTRGGERVDPAFAGGRPIVYVSFGSQAWHQPARFDRVLAAAAELDLAVLAAMGDLAVRYAAGAPRHVRCVAYADQLAALPHARVLVTHGGANSLMEGLAHGVPLLVSPICNDQPHGARFVENAGCGAVIDLERARHAEVVAALARLAADGPERASATAIGASYRALGTTGAGAADLVERAA